MAFQQKETTSWHLITANSLLIKHLHHSSLGLWKCHHHALMNKTILAAIKLIQAILTIPHVDPASLWFTGLWMKSHKWKFVKFTTTVCGSIFKVLIVGFIYKFYLVGYIADVNKQEMKSQNNMKSGISALTSFGWFPALLTLHIGKTNSCFFFSQTLFYKPMLPEYILRPEAGI